MKHIKYIFPLLTLLLSSCGGSPSTSSELSSSSSISSSSVEPVDDAISYIAKTASGKTYYMMDKKPITPIGVQIRVDLLLYAENVEFEVIEDRFTRAKDLGVSLIELPIPWKNTEPSKDAYNFRDLGRMMNLADKLGLKIEILTFGTNTTGWSDNVPQYIKDDADTYPRYKSNSPSSYFLVQNDPDLLEREGKWIDAMMTSIASWSESHEGRHVVASIQVHNESDTFPRFVLEQQKIMTVDGSRRLTDIEAWKETLEAYDYLGGIVKRSAYKCITRVNVAQAYKDAWSGFVPRIFELENIDIVGDDTYEKTVAFNKEMILDFNSEEYFGGNNFPHVSENDGSYETTPSLVLASTALGGGYLIYDLATPRIAIESYGWDDWSILDSKTLEDKPHTPLTRNIIKGITKAGSKYVLADKENIAAFNVKGNVPEEHKTQNIQTTHAVISFVTGTKALGYAVTSDKEIFVYATSASQFTFGNVSLSKCEKGYVDTNGEFVSDGEVTLTNDSLLAEGETLYRILVNKVDGTLVSNTVRNIG